MSRAVCIQGGGADGRFAGEVLAQLITQGFTFDAGYGVSAGSMVMALASRLGIRKGLDIWDQEVQGFFDVFGPRLNDESGLFNADPLRKILHKHLDGTQAAFPYTVGMVGWNDGLTYNVQCQNHPKHIEAVLASSAIPILCKPVPNDGIVEHSTAIEFMDGGAAQLTPLRPAVEHGFDEILVILCQPNKPGLDPFAPIDLPLVPEIQLAQRATRALSTLMHAAMLDDLMWVNAKQANKVSVVAPRANCWSFVDFTPKTNTLRVAEATYAAQNWKGF